MSLERRTLALIEDDPIMGESLVQRLELEGATVHWWRRAEDAVAGLAKAPTDAVICDIRLPDGSGEDLYRQVSSIDRCPPFLFVTGFGDLEQAVRLMREGAHDYITKPFEMRAFLERLLLIMAPLDADEETTLGVSPQMRGAEQFLRRIAKSQSPLLITGETGVGKDVSARLLHSLRPQPAGPLVAVNCAALPADLMESELFGHERGAFTGAHTRHYGYAERAGKGILFLDEIGELPLKLQSKLLRLIEERRFHRLGGESEQPFQARIVCATNADLDERAKRGEFRQDLLFRINVLTLRLAPLRERPADIAWLMDRMLAELTAATNSEVRGFAASTYAAAEAYSWPGNARELRNRIERALALAMSRWIMPGDLLPDHVGTSEAQLAPIQALGDAKEEAERQHIQRALKMTDGALQPAAKLLGISRTTLWEKMKRYGMGANSS